MEEWITQSEWERLLDQSHARMEHIKFIKCEGGETARLWGQLRLINERIRSPFMKVRGIDDRLTTTSHRAGQQGE